MKHHLFIPNENGIITSLHTKSHTNFCNKKANTFAALITVMALVGCSGSGGGSNENTTDNEGSSDSASNNEDTDNTENNDTGNEDTGDVTDTSTQDELNDDRFTYTDYPGVTANEDGKYFTVGASSITYAQDGIYNFLAGAYSYTAPIEKTEVLAEECIVLEGATSVWVALTARSAFTPEIDGNLIVSNDAGTFLTIPPEFDFYNYYDGNFTGQQPENLVADFTGMKETSVQFPMPNVEPLVLNFDIKAATITENTTYTWVPGTDPEAYINITGTISDDPYRTFDCIANDDGEFTLSQRVKDRIGQSFVSDAGNIERVRTDLSVVNNVGVRASAASSILYRR